MRGNLSLYSVEVLNGYELVEKFNLSDLDLKVFSQMVFDGQFEVVVKLADIGQENSILHDGREMDIAQFLSLFHQDLGAKLK